MIMTGMFLNTDVDSLQSYLTDELQKIISKYWVHFDEQPVNQDDIEMETESEVDDEGVDLR